MKLKFVIIITILSGLFTLTSFMVSAQSCTGDPCVFYTPTITPTAPPTATPGAGTPTAVPNVDPAPFPQINFGIPTSIPDLNLIAVPSPYAPALTPVPSPYAPVLTPVPAAITITTIATPSIISISLPSVPNPISPTNVSIPTTGTVNITLTNIITTIPISYSTAYTLGVGLVITNSPYFTSVTDMVSSTNAAITDLVSYTNGITEEYIALRGSEVLTVVTAPSEYAPTLPRPMADIGYTFEQYQDGIDSGQRFSVASWGNFLGYIVSMPFKLAKTLWVIATYLGPFGLFLGWLFILFGFVALQQILVWLWRIIITLIDLAKEIWEVIPGN